MERNNWGTTSQPAMSHWICARGGTAVALEPTINCITNLLGGN